VQDNEVNRRKDKARRQQDTQKLLDALESGKVSRSLEGGLPVSSSHKSLSSEENVGAAPSSSIPALPPSEVIPVLRTLQHTQNSHDAARYLEDLRCSMRAAMQTGSDVVVVEMMQVPREEMPEAMKTLQRALERVVERQECAVGLVEDVSSGADSKGKEKEVEAAPLDPVAIESGSDWWMRDTLDQEFIETGIEALRRLSEGLEAMPLPSWTITR
jgi:abelson tyrosine-protein kinase 1